MAEEKKVKKAVRKKATTQKNKSRTRKQEVRRPAGSRRVLLSGNEACVEGALAAGVGFFAGYPITPATEISEILSMRLPAIGGKFIQMEDEISSIAAIIGGSIAGLKSMTATSGPGFSLMQENLGFAIITEIPIVVVDVMRGGPSTGLPTNVSQGDVMQSRWGTHGDHRIIVLCPNSVEEVYRLTIKAFNYSEKYRTPVILLMDEVIGHMRETVWMPPEENLPVINRIRPSVPPEWYKPYEVTPTNVPPMAAFGDGYRYHITGLVHDQNGFPTRRPDEVKEFRARLRDKIELARSDLVKVEAECIDDARIAVLAYGSVSRSARRAVVLARKGGTKVGLVRPVTLWPFPYRSVSRLADHVDVIIVPELNMGQYVGEVERYACGKCRVVPLNRIDGEFIEPEEILECILEVDGNVSE
ncbi:MAG TPA: 2-oxoacid:acceptor oxidoreductase subunit alpha [bacterium]|nr:2-oxoacid:acceptor oxidoreductase subunit alpha [bacterium]